LKYPALEIAGVDGELALAAVDDYRPTAAQQAGDSITIFFRDPDARDAARSAIARALPSAIVTARDVDDEDWARRSQQNLRPITVGRITVCPSAESRAPGPGAIIIQPSMGFGTGHHATTRLCLAALQQENLNGAFVLDVGTGSGVLAIAAVRLGAGRAVGIDNDPDAIQAARENLTLNPEVTGVTFEQADFTAVMVRLKADTTTQPPIHPTTQPTTQATSQPYVVSGFSRTVEDRADVVTANLTGALLAREAVRLLAAVKPGGRLIVSGLLDTERAEVLAAFASAPVVREGREDEWVGLTLRPS
jgi:ribosomal protein L11 methyltransferase